MREELRLFFIAMQFLTRVPIPASFAREPWDPERLDRSVRYFPLVGALLGASGGALAWIAAQLWPPLVAAVLSVAFTLWLSVAFHEDGLADTADALLGAAARERALEIMKDSRIGSYGAAILGLSLLLRVVLFASLLATQPLLAAAACIAVHALARAGALGLMITLPYAGDEAHAKAKPLARNIRIAEMFRALPSIAVALLPVLFLASGSVVAAVVGMLAATGGIVLLVVLLRRWLLRRLGGYTGDALGACEQLGEIVLWLVFVAAWNT